MFVSNREEVRRIVFGEDGVEYFDIVWREVLVSFDGIWFRRGFLVNYGISFLIFVLIGKVFD